MGKWLGSWKFREKLVEIETCRLMEKTATKEKDNNTRTSIHDGLNIITLKHYKT